LPARQSHPRLAAVSIAASIGFLLALIALTFRPVVEGDGVGYYAYLHAVLVSHSLAFTSEYSAAVNSHVPLYLPLVSTRTPTGQLADYFPIGSAVLAAPAFLVALVLQRSGEPQYGSPFVDAFTVASLLYGLIAGDLLQARCLCDGKPARGSGRSHRRGAGHSFRLLPPV